MNDIHLPKVLAKRKCKCGNIIGFHHLYKVICRNCGRLVYPTKKMEYDDKLKRLVKRK